uniref:Uncharacterized protein n=1 Tax=Rhipicephalus zambeziensis TaxID=60191 RepID=A0A224Y9J2_9ACAR
MQYGGQSCANATPIRRPGAQLNSRGPPPGSRPLSSTGSSSGSSAGAPGCCGFNSRGRRGAVEGVPTYRPHPAPQYMTHQQLKPQLKPQQHLRGFSVSVTHPGGPRRTRLISQPLPSRPHQERQPAYSRIL